MMSNGANKETTMTTMTTTMRIRDLTSGDRHEVGSYTPARILRSDDDYEAQGGALSLLADADAAPLATFAPGERAWVRSEDPDTERPGRVLWWASEIL